MYGSFHSFEEDELVCARFQYEEDWPADKTVFEKNDIFLDTE